MAQPLAQSPWDCSGYLTEAEAAGYIRTPQETLRKWRRLGTGPVPVRMPNGRIFYPQHLLDQWKQQLIDEARAEAEKRQPGPGRGRRRRRSQPEQLGDDLRDIPA